MQKLKNLLINRIRNFFVRLFLESQDPLILNINGISIVITKDNDVSINGIRFLEADADRMFLCSENHSAVEAEKQRFLMNITPENTPNYYEQYLHIDNIPAQHQHTQTCESNK